MKRTNIFFNSQKNKITGITLAIILIVLLVLKYIFKF